MIEASIAVIEENDDCEGYLELLNQGNEGGRLLCQLIEWLHGLERNGGGWYRDGIDHFAGVIVDTLVDLLDCSPDIFVKEEESLNHDLGVPILTEDHSDVGKTRYVDTCYGPDATAVMPC